MTTKETTNEIETARWIRDHGLRALTTEQARFIRDTIAALQTRPATPRERAAIEALRWLVQRARLP